MTPKRKEVNLPKDRHTHTQRHADALHNNTTSCDIWMPCKMCAYLHTAMRYKCGSSRSTRRMQHTLGALCLFRFCQQSRRVAWLSFASGLKMYLAVVSWLCACMPAMMRQGISSCTRDYATHHSIQSFCHTVCVPVLPCTSVSVKSNWQHRHRRAIISIISGDREGGWGRWRRTWARRVGRG